MKFDWYRIKRTAIQSLIGAVVAFLSTILSDCTKEAVITGIVQFIATVGIAVCMNMQAQIDEKEGDTDD